jgi:hypothetical protein
MNTATEKTVAKSTLKKMKTMSDREKKRMRGQVKTLLKEKMQVEAKMMAVLEKSHDSLSTQIQNMLAHLEDK